jgi:hypothetical protein
MWLLLLFLAGLAHSAKVCEKYMCNPPAKHPGFGTYCIRSKDNNEIWFNECPTGTYCNISNQEVVTTTECSKTAPTPPPKELSLPGEPCKTNADCLHNSQFALNCNASNICEGLSSGAVCVNSKQCDVGLYCHYGGTNPGGANTCMPQVLEGGDCYEDSDCVNTCGCDRGYFARAD